MIVVHIDDTINMRGVMPKWRKDKKQNQLQICVDNKMAICQGPVVNMSQLIVFPPTVKSKVMDPQEEVVEEPVNKFDFRSSTIEEHKDPTTPKHNFNETFDRPMFKGRSSEGGVHLKGEPRSRWMHDHHMTVSSHPYDCLDSMLPTYKHLHKKQQLPISYPPKR